MCSYANRCANSHSRKNFSGALSVTYFSVSQTALNIILWLRCNVGKFDTLFLTRPLTLSKSEPTFAVTSSTSVNVSMLTKTPSRRVSATPQRHTSRPGKSDSRSRRLRRLCSASLHRDHQRSELSNMSAITRRCFQPECH